MKFIHEGVEYDKAILAGRPIDKNDYTPERRAAYEEVVEAIGMEPPLYPGHISKPCCVCDVATQVGPRQQDQVIDLGGEDTVLVVCLLDVPILLDLQESSEPTTIVTLGNPHPPIKKESK